MEITQASLPNILLWDRKLKNKQCQPIETFGDECAAMRQILINSCLRYRGAGIAAPQLGIFRRVAVVRYPEDSDFLYLVNPVIDEVRSSGESTEFEACLSLPGANTGGNPVHNRSKVRRCRKIFYSYQDEKGEKHEAEAEGMLARVISHEVDHLSGVFFIDRTGDVSRGIVLRQYENYCRYLKPS